MVEGKTASKETLKGLSKVVKGLSKHKAFPVGVAKEIVDDKKRFEETAVAKEHRQKLEALRALEAENKARIERERVALEEERRRRQQAENERQLRLRREAEEAARREWQMREEAARRERQMREEAEYQARLRNQRIAEERERIRQQQIWEGQQRQQREAEARQVALMAQIVAQMKTNNELLRRLW